MKNTEYVFWYANDYDVNNLDHLIEYCNIKPIPEQKPIFFSSSKVDKTKNNIFFIKAKILGLGLEELLDYKDEIKWCDDNGITVVYDNSWESIFLCIPKNNIQEIKNIIPKKFKIFCNFEEIDIQNSNGEVAHLKYVLKYAINVMFFPMYLGLQMELLSDDAWNVINPSKNIKRKYLFSLLCGEIRKPHRALTLAGLMAEDLLSNSFYTTFLRDHGDEFQSTNSLYPSDAWVFDETHQYFKYAKYLKDNHDKILVNKLFDSPSINHNNEMGELFFCGELLQDDLDFRIPIQMHESYFNIVMETFAWHQFCFYTEKTFKPMIAEKPFIICGTINQNQYLESLGFEIFPEIFDYSFEKIPVNYIEGFIEGFVAEIKRVSELPLSVFDQPSVLEKIKHNKDLITKLGSKENVRSQLIDLLS